MAQKTHKTQKDKKLYPKNNGQKMQTQVNLYFKNNDHAQIIHKTQFSSSFKIAKDNLVTIRFGTRKSASQVRKNIQMRDLIFPVFQYVLFATCSAVMNAQESFHE